MTNLPPKKLLDQVRAAMRLKHYSLRTEDTYVEWIRRYILFHQKRHPKDMGVAEVEAFVLTKSEAALDQRVIRRPATHSRYFPIDTSTRFLIHCHQPS